MNDFGIYTSYFGRIRSIPKDITPVAICRGLPKWYQGRREIRLAPTWAMLKMPPEEYRKHYNRILARLDPKEIVESLGKSVVLLCWEKEAEKCHRRIVAEWLEKSLGIEVPELG